MKNKKNTNSSKSALGRGLSNLISQGSSPSEQPKNSTPATQAPSPYQDIPVASIDPSPYQARKDINPDDIQSLADSIAAEGLLQPIVLRQNGSRFELIAGERRWRAFQHLNRATIPARIVYATNASAAIISLIENLQRENLNPIDEALGYQSLMNDFDLTQDQVALRLSKPRTSIANALRLTKLEPEIQAYVAKGLLTPGHAKLLLSLTLEAQRLLMARRIIEAGLSVRESEKLLKQIKEKGATTLQAKSTQISPEVQSAVIKDLQKQIGAHLSTKVTLKHNTNTKKGKIEIAYSGNDDLHRILDTIGFERPKVG